MFDIFHWVLQGLRAVCLASSVATARRDPKEIRERKKKKESTRRQAASHGGNKKSRADLIWGGERDRDERDQKEPNNQKRKKENENHV
jgi:hypothetical protein